jgi:hypothetical protein
LHIRDLSIKNYKSYLESPAIHFEPGFNVVVGENNVGKTALAEALSLSFSNNPHRSTKTVPQVGIAPPSTSSVVVSVTLTSEDLQLIWSEPQFMVPLRRHSNIGDAFREFERALTQEPTLVAYVSNGQISNAQFPKYNEADHGGHWFRVSIDPQTGRVALRDHSLYAGAYAAQHYGMQLANVIKQRIYFFNAERLKISEFSVGTDPILRGDASNLPQVLNLLQTRNPHRFSKFNDYVRLVFPQIGQITVPPGGSGASSVQVFVWSQAPETQREDLASKLAESGTGVGQVLAMLYVVLTADHPRILIIDEPQSFLHPGAIRKLFEIFKLYPQHQYIITSHSPTAIVAAEPKKLLLVRKSGFESTVQEIDAAQNDQLRLYLAEIGARLSDVFGADNILWVEGRTEEVCIPKIVARVLNKQLFGTAIVGVVHTSDFEGKRARTAIEMYRRLSSGQGLLPPAIGFVFDRELRTKREQEDLEREGRGTIKFISRRMYENYLIDPTAISNVLNPLKGSAVQELTNDVVENWLRLNRWDSKYFDVPVREADRIETLWQAEVHGGRVLQDLFGTLSEGTVEYDKVAHGSALTDWIIENDAARFQDLADLLSDLLKKTPPPMRV